jgi:hypothetical protein
MGKQEKDIHKKLSEIEKKLEDIDGKLSEKWVLPVSIAVLTAVLGTLNFLIERNVGKNDISEIKQSEVIGEYVAKSKIEFYQRSREHLNNIDEQFESYCTLGREKVVGDKLDTLLISIREFVLSQQVIDQEMVDMLKEYAEFVSERAVDVGDSKTDKAMAKQIYEESKALHKDIIIKLDSKIGELLKL